MTRSASSVLTFFSRTWGLGLLWVLSWLSAKAAVGINVNPDTNRVPISPLIYGSNQDVAGVDFTLRRQGGNRMTGYNWENNASNAGSDYLHQSDDYLTWIAGIIGTQASVPGIVVTNFHDQSVAANHAYSIVTLPMAGYVAADKSGPVTTGQIAPSSRWVQRLNTKPSALSLSPDLNDGKVYSDELLNFLLNRYGSAASTTGIKGYALDNEPDLWSSTHARLHPAQPLCAELITRNVDLAKTVKRIDPTAETLGFVSYGFGGYYDFQGATDWATEKNKGSYRWFIDYYLDQMKQASTTAGLRLLNVLDLHNYSEAQGGGARVTDNTDYTNIACNKARLQAPRAFWDATYVENSWIGQYFAGYMPFLPNIEQSISTFYPGTKLGFTEYNFGGENHISGGIAQADILGIFGKSGVYLASLWPLHGDLTYTAAAFKLYRNYDGTGQQFGDTSVTASASDVVTCSTFASLEGSSTARLHVIVLNKNYDASTPLDFTITGGTTYTSARVFAFDAATATITERAAVTSITGNRFSYTLPPLTAAHFVLAGVVTLAPAITTQPASQTIIAGNSVAFTGAASGVPTPTYQWQKGGVDVGSATNSTYTILSVAPGDAGSYALVATNSVSSVTSNSATLTVNVAPAITTQPASQAVTAGNSVTFTGGASGAPTPTLQWRKGGVDIGGATDSSYTITSVSPGDAGSYALIATNSVTSATSASATLTVYTVPLFTTQPASQTIIAGNSVTFIAAASGAPAPTYQWQKGGVDIGGETNGSYTIGSVAPSDAGNYTVIASNAVTAVASNPALLTVNTAPVITTQPVNQTVTSTTAATYTVIANGNPTPTYQWQKNNVAISGATNSTFSIAAAALTDAGSYSVVVTNSVSSVTSNAATLTVNLIWQIAGTGDFDADGKVDILWRKTTTGAVALWLMNGTTLSSTAAIATVAPDWQIAGTGDFNADGKVDILWRKVSTGAVAVWYMNGPMIASTAVIATVFPDWQIAGTGDFNADGKGDILWRKVSTGAVAVWYMNGAVISSTALIATVTPDWQIAGTGDFNNDGKVDILWRKISTGAVAVWLMNGSTISSTVVISTITPDWQIAGTGDFNADTKVDLLWRKKSTGAVAVWLMNGVAISSTAVIGTAP